MDFGAIGQRSREELMKDVGTLQRLATSSWTIKNHLELYYP